MSGYLNKYLLENFGVSIDNYRFLRPFSKNFIVIDYKNEELVVPFVTGFVNGFFLLGEFFSEKNIEEDFVYFNGDIYKKFVLNNKLLFLLRLEREKRNFDFYFITPKFLFIKVPRFYFGRKYYDKYTKFFEILEGGKYEKMLKLISPNNVLIKHLILCSNAKEITEKTFS